MARTRRWSNSTSVESLFQEADFTSALFLGLYHPSAMLPDWPQMTSGVPAALREDPETTRVAGRLARLVGCQAGLAFPSTLHLFHDLFDFLGRQRIRLLVDDHAYPIAQWGTERASLLGVRIEQFAHADPECLKKALSGKSFKAGRPVVVTDGWCTVCGKPMPISKYASLLQAQKGWLIIDDTQSLGVLGRQTASPLPYGRGGGGTIPWLGHSIDRVIVCSSLAKAFGVPIAVMSGPFEVINAIRRNGLSRYHCSPPSLAHVKAASRALWLNQTQGEQLRQQLWENVKLFRQGLHLSGIRIRGGIFPVQRVTELNPRIALLVYQTLNQTGLKTVLTTNHQGVPEISFLLRADHSKKEIDTAVSLIVSAIRKVAK